MYGGFALLPHSLLLPALFPTRGNETDDDDDDDDDDDFN